MLTDEKCLNMEPGIIGAPSDHTPMSSHPFVRIVLPVYNEEGVLEKSVRTLHSFLTTPGNFPYPFVLTIVDNGSSDSTPVIGARLAQEFASVTYISIPEKGKAAAIRRGWREAGDIFAFMDIDLASDLTFFPTLIDEIVSGSDLAIGSRLGTRSHIENRRFIRGVMSRFYNALVRFMFRDGIRDHQCGFKAIRADAYQRIAKKLTSTGWFFDTELIVLARAEGMSIASVDIRWVDDRQSKVSLLKTSAELIAALLALYERVTDRGGGRGLVKQIIFFAVSGGTAGLVNLITYTLALQVVGMWYIYAVFVAAAASFCTSFVMQKWLTFRELTLKRVPVQFGMHLVLAGMNVVCNALLVLVLVEYLGVPQLFAQVPALALLAVINFTVYRYVIFTPRIP